LQNVRPLVCAATALFSFNSRLVITDAAGAAMSRHGIRRSLARNRWAGISETELLSLTSSRSEHIVRDTRAWACTDPALDRHSLWIHHFLAEQAKDNGEDTLEQQHTIVVASRDPELAEIRRRLLEAAGYNVISVKEPSEVGRACRQTHVSLLVIGYSVQPSKKRLIWREARNKCRVPVLELYQNGEAELVPAQALFAHEAPEPEGLLMAVQHILSNSSDRRLGNET
jgi:hypothetical protein